MVKEASENPIRELKALRAQYDEDRSQFESDRKMWAFELH